MQDNKVKIDKGDLLVSQPFMIDGNFRRSVIFLTEYNEEGALGFIINRPIEFKVDELIGDFPNFDKNAFYGNSVATNTIHYIHRRGDVLDESMEVKNGIFWGGNFEKLKLLISSDVISTDDIKFYVGYSGWSPGQLEDELIHGSWIIAPSDSNYIFNSKESELWSKVLKYKGDNFEVIAQMPEVFFPN